MLYFSRFKINSGKENNGSRTTKAVFDAIIDPETQAKHFSWSGRAGKDTPLKMSFKVMAPNVVEFIYRICLQVEENYSKEAYTARLKDILKTAKTRTMLYRSLNEATRTKNLQEKTETCEVESVDATNVLTNNEDGITILGFQI